MSKNDGTSSPRKRKSSLVSPARTLAVDVLERVWNGGAYAAPTLDAALRRAADMDSRDRRLATELVYGVLRTAGYLDKRIKAHANNDRWRHKPTVRAHMLIAVYSLAFLDRVPDHAAVSEAVNAIKNSADSSIGGFANAVLRKIAREKIDIALEDAIARAVPRWLVTALERSIGEEEAAAFMGELDEPPLCLWLREGRDRDPWIERLRSKAGEARIVASPHSPRGIRVWSGGDSKKLPGANVDWVVQEEGAQVIALAVGARPGDVVLDACAGRGGKTLVLGEAVGETGAVDSADLHAKKLERLKAGPAGRVVRATHAVDWTRGTGDVTQQYDRVLVDAPCSGVGTMRRRPEIAGRLGASDVDRLAALQLRIAIGAARCVKPGGRLVFAVCSVLEPECEGIVAALTGTHGDVTLTPVPFDADLPLVSGETSVRLLPHRHGTDGYFLASFAVS